MKFEGKTFKALARGEAIIPRGAEDLRLLIRGVPIGWAEEAEEKMAAPTPPRSFVHRGKERETVIDREDPSYLKALDLHRARMNALYIREALKEDSRVVFDTPEGGDLVVQADGVIAELRAAGFSGGDCQCLIQQIDALSNNTMEQINEARSRFLRERQAAAGAGGSQSGMA